ncbi:MAG: DUF1911 domain-containing protein [Saprospiraceae bacterium]|nr:DUF1911 domain-containing protein [Saprospiraceae bacterium]
MRDKNITQNDYFDKKIDSLNELINYRLDGLLIEKYQKENIPGVKNGLFYESFEILIAKYSRGDSMNELKEEFPKVLKYMEDGWDDSVVKFKMGRPTKIYDFYWINDYCYMLWMLSFATLLKVSKNEIDILHNLIEKGNIDDKLLLYILGHLNKKLYAKTSIQKYEPFKRIYKKAEVENIDSQHLKKYLQNWYKHTNYLTWHNYLNSVEKGKFSYFGYWSFETAAIVAIMDLDDSSFRDNQYYPKDLVDYYRANS